MSMDFIGLSVGMGYTDETVIGGGALKGKNCVVSNIEEVADGVNVTFQWTLDNGTVQTETVLLPKGTQGEAGVDGKSAYEIWLEAGNTGTEEDFLISLVGENKESFRVFEHVIANSDTKQYLPNLNDALDNTIYRIQLIDDTTLDNMPSDYPYSDMDVYFVITITNKYDAYGKNYIQKIQYIIRADFAKIYYRGYFKSWSEWKLAIDNTNVKRVITCGEGKEYTTLRSAIARGCELGCEVVVYPGTYDLKDEFPNVQVDHNATGIPLYGGVYVKFLAGSYVKAIFDNNDRWIYDNFQPFYSAGDFTLDGLNIEAANTRYCVHDEHAGNGTHHHVYKNCVMKYTNEHEDISYVQCIGGGLGQHDYIEIDGGYYESKTTVPAPTLTLEESQMPITYHNGWAQNCDGKIVIKNVYLADKGYFRFGMYGSSQIKTKIYVNGCSMYKPIWNMYENSDYTVENFEIIEFNNEVRNAE